MKYGRFCRNNAMVFNMHQPHLRALEKQALSKTPHIKSINKTY